MHCYLMPAAERAERVRDEAKMPAGLPAGGATGPASLPSPRSARKASTAPDYEPGTPGHRRQIIEQAFMGVMGLKRDAAERLYEKQLADWRAQQEGG